MQNKDIQGDELENWKLSNFPETSGLKEAASAFAQSKMLPLTRT